MIVSHDANGITPSPFISILFFEHCILVFCIMIIVFLDNFLVINTLILLGPTLVFFFLNGGSGS